VIGRLWLYWWLPSPPILHRRHVSCVRTWLTVGRVQGLASMTSLSDSPVFWKGAEHAGALSKEEDSVQPNSGWRRAGEELHYTPGTGTPSGDLRQEQSV
jgi:hypothetical protein